MKNSNKIPFSLGKNILSDINTMKSLFSLLSKSNHRIKSFVRINFLTGSLTVLFKKSRAVLIFLGVLGVAMSSMTHVYAQTLPAFLPPNYCDQAGVLTTPDYFDNNGNIIPLRSYNPGELNFGIYDRNSATYTTKSYTVASTPAPRFFSSNYSLFLNGTPVPKNFRGWYDYGRGTLVDFDLGETYKGNLWFASQDSNSAGLNYIYRAFDADGNLVDISAWTFETSDGSNDISAVWDPVLLEWEIDLVGNQENNDSIIARMNYDPDNLWQTFQFRQGGAQGPGGMANWLGEIAQGDYSDSPANYATNGGAFHFAPTICNAEDRVMIGNTVTNDVLPYASGLVIGNIDSSTATGDLDDGNLVFQSYLPNGRITCTGDNGTYTTQAGEYCVVVNVMNDSANPAQLVGWLDFSNATGVTFTPDRVFSDAERSLPDLGGDGVGVLVADSDGNTADGTFDTGNISPGFSGDVVLVWTGLGGVDRVNQSFQTFSRFRLTGDGYDPNGDGDTSDNTGFFSDASPEPSGNIANGEVEDHFVSFDILPVTLSNFSSERVGDRVNIDWGTSSELFNVGFQLWGLDGVDGQWEKLHNWLVKSGSGNAVEPQSYTKRVRIPTSIDQLVSVGISSVDSDGSEHYYGPFELGVSYGELGDLAPIAWDQVRAELDTRMAAQGYTKSGVNGYRKASSTSTLALSGSDNESVIEFRVSTPGVYRITGSELPQVWHSVPKGELAVLDYQGNGVVRHVQAKGQGSGSTRALGAAGSIYFYSEGVNETQRLYSEAKVYRLVLDSAHALNAPIQSKQGVTSGFSESYREVSVVEEDESYIFHSAVDDPWLDEVVIGFSDKLRVRRQPVPVEADLLIEDSATLLLGLGRSSALGAIDLDSDGVQDAEHIVTGTVTDAEGVKVKLDPVSAVGSGRWDLALPIPAGTLLGDANGIVHSGAFFNAGEGYAFSEVHIDSIGLEYSRPYVSKAGEDHLLFRGPDTGELGYSVTVPDTGWPWVFASDGSNLVRIGLESQRRVTDSAGVKWREVTFSKLLSSELSPLSIHYWVSGRNGFYGVEGLVDKVVPSQASVLAQAQGSDYVMVSHPMFMGPAQAGVDPLSTYAEFKQGQGYTVSIVNYLDLVDSFGGGQVGPWGLTHYLSELKLQSPLLKYVLLVGSSVYDHSDKLGTGALTFIPGHYVPGSHSDYTVSDVPYITHDDGALFAHIGRWPVRELSELQVIVDKSMQWGSTAHHQGEALLIAEHTVLGEEINFAQALDGVAEVLPATYSQHKVYVDALLAADPDLSLTQALALAKGQIIDGLNNAPEVVVYNGHASTGQLSNQNLFKHSDVDEVTTAGAEIWVPLSCYVTYYESTTVNTLAHQLMFTGNAVAITGAMLLSNQAENIQMGQSILDSTFNQGQSIGEAVNQAKAIQNNPSLTNNWATLGDPSAVLMTQ